MMQECCNAAITCCKGDEKGLATRPLHLDNSLLTPSCVPEGVMHAFCPVQGFGSKVKEHKTAPALGWGRPHERPSRVLACA
eukprot:1158916-Pelagomonas_calceolata.AAC.13